MILVFFTLPSCLLCNYCGDMFKSYKHGLCAYMDNDNKMSFCEAVTKCANHNGQLVSNYDNLVTVLLEETVDDKVNRSYYIGVTLLQHKYEANKKKATWNGNDEDVMLSTSSGSDGSCVVYSFTSDNKQKIEVSSCTETHHYICEEVVVQSSYLVQSNLSPAWMTKWSSSYCATTHTVDRTHTDLHCTLMCYKQRSCRSFGYSSNGECRLSSLSYVLASSGAHHWHQYSIRVSSQRWYFICDAFLDCVINCNQMCLLCIKYVGVRNRGKPN